MKYNYEEEISKVPLVNIILLKDKLEDVFEVAGAIHANEALKRASRANISDSWKMMAAIEFLERNHFIKRIEYGSAWQTAVYIKT